MKILFLTISDQSAASSRYRVYQYLDYFKKEKVECVASSNLKENLFKLTQYDVIIIQKKLYPWWVERVIKFLNPKLIFDFDDAIFTSPNMNWSWYTKKKVNLRLSNILKISRWVIVGNKFLKEYAQQFNKKVVVIPTSIDINRYPVKGEETKEKVTIGWIGSSANLIYLRQLENVFKAISDKFPQVVLKVICDKPFETKNIPTIDVKWDINRELEELLTVDIGIMPLEDNLWTRGKCAFKALQCMALGIPVVCSLVGANKEVIKDNENGLLANTEDEWIDKISLLVTDSSLRKKLGKEGRRTVEDSFSSQVNFPKLKEVIFNLVR